MAQPVFEEHPLENYLRRASDFVPLSSHPSRLSQRNFAHAESGEGVEAMPGGMSDIQVHGEVTLDDGDDPGEDIMYMLPPQVVQCLEVRISIPTTPHCTGTCPCGVTPHSPRPYGLARLP